MTPASAGFYTPRQICHICRRQMIIPPRKINYARNAGVSPPRHLWRGGGRQARGEVKQAGGEVKQAGGEVKQASARDQNL